MADLLEAPTESDTELGWTLEHIVSEKDPDTALCGADMTGCEPGDGLGELCVVCGELGGEIEL